MPSLDLINTSRPLLALFALALAACTFPEVVGDSPLAGTTGTTGSDSSSSSPTDPGVPDSDAQAALCAGFTDEVACLAAGCSEFTKIVPTTVDDSEDGCFFGPLTPVCLWFAGDAWGGPATPGAFYEIATGNATMFNTDWIDPPVGWGDCGDADAPPACTCFGTCAVAQQHARDFLADDQPCADVSDCVMADGICFKGNVCGNVGVHKDSQPAWDDLQSMLSTGQCCEGADPCGATLACQNQRCVATFP